MVQLTQLVILAPASRRRVHDLIFRLRQEAASNWTVGVEGDAVLAQGGEQFGLLPTAHGRVVSLVDGGQDVIVFFGDADNFFDFSGVEVGETEAAEFVGLVELIYAR